MFTLLTILLNLQVVGQDFSFGLIGQNILFGDGDNPCPVAVSLYADT